MSARTAGPPASSSNRALAPILALRSLGAGLLTSLRDVTPIIVVVALFQTLVLRQPLPDLAAVATGGIAVVVGLMLFVRGLEMGLFPMGELMAAGLARHGSLPWLVAFAFLLGFATTVAEPALIAIASEAAEVAADDGAIDDSERAVRAYALGLRITVALSVGTALVIGVVRILKGWSVVWLIVAGYLGIVVLTAIAPPDIIGIAYDAGGVTTSTITVPLVASLGVGLASAVRNRSPLTDGFGLIAFASLTPIVFVMAYGAIV